MHLKRAENNVSVAAATSGTGNKPQARLPEVADDLIAPGVAGILALCNVTGLNVDTLVLCYLFGRNFKVHGFPDYGALVHPEFLPLICKRTQTHDSTHTLQRADPRLTRTGSAVSPSYTEILKTRFFTIVFRNNFGRDSGI